MAFDVQWLLINLPFILISPNFQIAAFAFLIPESEKAYSPFQRELRRIPNHTASTVLCKAIAKPQLVSGLSCKCDAHQEAEWRPVLLFFFLCQWHHQPESADYRRVTTVVRPHNSGFTCPLCWAGSLTRNVAFQRSLHLCKFNHWGSFFPSLDVRRSHVIDGNLLHYSC